MKYINQFLKLSRDKKTLLFKTLILMGIIRILLWILPFRKMQNIIKKLGNWKIGANKKETISQLSWGVEVTSKFIPQATCLVKALTAQILFIRSDHPSKLKIGVNKDEFEGLEAHAWLEVEDQIVIGQSQKEYHTIWSMN